jgi:PAS domain S-box-containing protein
VITNENSGFNILVVDDDPDLLRIIERLLKEQNYFVSTAVSGQECLQAIRLDPPDLLLLDVMLPDISGIDICKTIKKDPQLSSIYVILLSGMKTQSEIISEGLETGADGYLIMPLQKKELLARVDAAFKTICAEKMLRESEERYRQISSTISDISYSCVINQNGDYSIDWMAGAAEQITGYSMEEFKAIQCWGKFVVDEDLDSFNQHVIGLTPGSSSTCELRLRHKNGAIIWVASSAKCENEQEHYGHIKLYGALVDISERKLAEEKLQKTLNDLKISQRIAQIGSWEYNLASNTFTGSEEIIRLLGFLPGSVLGFQEISDCIIPEDREQALKGFAHLIQTGETFTNVARMIKKDTGEIRDFLSISELRLDQNGQPTAVFGVNQDITKRIRAEQELIKAKEHAEESDRLKTAFMNNISHEIRTPLNGILGFSQLMADPDLTKDERAHYYSIVKSSSHRLMNTVTDFMDMSLIASGNQEVQKKLFAPGDLLDEIYNRFLPIGKTKNLALSLQIPPATSKLYINSDQELLHNVLSHLVDNAIKFTDQGRVSLGFETKGNEFEFFITDTGVGINKEVQPTIFDKFMQENVSNTRGHEGCGLGLPIAKGIVELLGGRIWFESGKGQGSAFYFTIPVEMAADKIPVNHETGLNTNGKPLILIAEDDLSGSLLLERILRKQGVDILVVNDGQKAVAACRQNPVISLVLMDLKMPVLDGFEATKQIKSFKPSLPIIAITAYALSGDENRALKAGCDDYIAKPFETELLLGKLKKYGITN